MAVLREIGVKPVVQRSVWYQPERWSYGYHRDEPAYIALSALASKATGFPDCKSGGETGGGFTLDELMNDITGGATPASFEPTIDYVVTKIPRFNFEKFAGANDRLTTQMKSVGEVMAIGRNQQESMQKRCAVLKWVLPVLMKWSDDLDADH